MNRIILLALTLFLVSCGSSESDEQQPTTSAPSTDLVETPEAELEEPSPLETKKSSDGQRLFRVRLEDRTDTLLTFDQVPLGTFQRFRYNKLNIIPEETNFVIEHPKYQYKLGEMPFDSAFSELTYNDDSSAVVLINGLEFYGTKGTIPRTQFSRFTYTPAEGNLHIIRPEDYEDLFNLNFQGEGKNGNPAAYSLPNNETIIVIHGGSDDAKYVAAFLFDGEGMLVKRRVQEINNEE